MAATEVYFRQLLAGRDFAAADPVARQMVNYTYAIGDRSTGEVLLIDPAYAVAELVDLVEADGMAITGALVTHYHADHAGGSLMGVPIEGLPELLALRSVPVHVNAEEVEWVRRSAGVSVGDLVGHGSGERVTVGNVEVELLHTPGHTPGSQCFLVDRMLISGDTLFLDGCGRTDLPGSDPLAMWASLQRLAALPGDLVVFPGHRYSAPSSATLDAVRELNVVFRLHSQEAWMAAFGGG